MNKKLLSVLFAMIFIISFVSVSANSYTVLYEGKKIEFDAEPYTKEERIMVPLRGIFEKAGAYVSWDNESNTAFISVYDGDTVIIAVKPNSNIAFVGETEVTMEVNAEVKNQRIMVPLRFIMDYLGKNVEWDQNTATVKISEYKGGV